MGKGFSFKNKACGVNVNERGRTLPVKDLKRLGLVIGFFVVVILVRTYLVQIVPVMGDSMNPTLNDGDILISRSVYGEIERYDIAVAKIADQYVIKRVIGLPGETVWIQGGSVYVNGDRVEGRYDFWTEDPGLAGEHFVLGEDEYFLLGDNRGVSYDSRGFGAVKNEQIVGIVLFRIYPISVIIKL